MQSAEMEKTRPSSDIMGARARGGLQLGDYKYELTYTPNYLHSLGRPWP